MPVVPGGRLISLSVNLSLSFLHSLVQINGKILIKSPLNGIAHFWMIASYVFIFVNSILADYHMPTVFILILLISPCLANASLISLVFTSRRMFHTRIVLFLAS